MQALQDNCGTPQTQDQAMDIFLFKKKVTKTVVVVAEYTCIVHLYASDAGTSAPGPTLGCALLWCIKILPVCPEQRRSFSDICS